MVFIYWLIERCRLWCLVEVNMHKRCFFGVVFVVELFGLLIDIPFWDGMKMCVVALDISLGFSRIVCNVDLRFLSEVNSFCCLDNLRLILELNWRCIPISARFYFRCSFLDCCLLRWYWTTDWKRPFWGFFLLQGSFDVWV